MKGIAISTAVYILIAVFSISLLIIYVGLNFSPTIRKAYCSFIMGLNSFLPLPESLKPSVPTFCEIAEGEVVIVESGDVDFISRKIAEYSLACWTITGRVNLERDRNCYEIVLKRVNGIVTNSTVVNNLPEGYENILNWKIGNITQPKSVGIYYNSTNKLIEVV